MLERPVPTSFSRATKPTRTGPVGSVVVLPIWAMVWAGCGPQLPLLGVKNWTEPDLKTLELYTSGRPP